MDLYLPGKVDVYVDESCQTGHQYMVLSALVVKTSSTKKIIKNIETLRHELQMFAELKWTKVTNQKFQHYSKFVDFTFEQLKSENFSFHSVIFDTHKINHKLFSQGYEPGFYKFVYQLLLHSVGRQYGTENKIFVYLDHRHTGYNILDLQKILNNGLNKSYKNDRRPFRVVQARDSKASSFLQLNDIILGALAFRKNKLYQIEGTRQAKIDLSENIFQKAKIKDSLNNTPMKRRDFTIWNFQLR